MLKRILAWFLLAGFVLLVVNIILFQKFLEPCIAVYSIIVVVFIFTNKPLPSNKKKAVSENKTQETSGEITETDIEEITQENAEMNNEDATGGNNKG